MCSLKFWSLESISKFVPSTSGPVKLFRNVLPRFVKLSKIPKCASHNFWSCQIIWNCGPSISGAVKLFRTVFSQFLELSYYLEVWYLDFWSCQNIYTCAHSISEAVKLFQNVLIQFLVLSNYFEVCFPQFLEQSNYSEMWSSIFWSCQIIPKSSIDFKNYQPFSQYHARKVKFRRFTCNKIGNEGFAAKNCDKIFSFRMFLEQKIYQ